MQEAKDILAAVKTDDSMSNIKELEHDGDLELNFKSMLESIEANQDENAILVVGGSVFIMESVRDLLGIKQHKDFENLNFQ